MQNQGTRLLRAAEAFRGARAYRRQMAFRDDLATQLHTIAPGIARVHLTPVTTDVDGTPRRQTLVNLLNSIGYTVEAPIGAHRAARRLLVDAFPAADWDRPLIYNVGTGYLMDNVPTAPAALGTDTAPEVTA
ncbi:hypothetical protein OG357_23125 [Streptomyces sp. NBC_01255]|uniref:hypothetical protein n=1 Tax=Streptomyces sp. NBC_01255 TaxID=2903798 RepID=UPI002E36AEF3|nr:hypothetical protein [Streptomyces sp. NBC_01255]